MQWLLEGDLFLAVKQHHGVEGRDAWDVEVAICEWSSVADSHSVGWENLEILVVLIGEFEVLSVHSILLESDAKRVEDSIVIAETDLIGLLFEG